MPSINDRIGSQNVIRVLSNASAPPSRLLNLTDVDSTSQTDGNLLIWDATDNKFFMSRTLDSTEGYEFTGGTNSVGIVSFSGSTQSESTITGAVIVSGGFAVGKNVNFAAGLNVVGIATFSNELDINAAVDILRGLNVSGITSVASLNIGATQVISSGRELQNIVSLDATTTATIEAAIEVAPNKFTDLKITGVSTFIGIATYAAGLQVFSGVSTFNAAVDIDAGLDVDGQTDLNELVVAGVSTFSNTVDINAGGQANTFKVEDLTDNRVVIAGTGGELEDDSNFTFDGATLSVGVKLDVDGDTQVDDLNVAGVSTFSNAVDINSTLDVDGDTQVDDLNVAGVATFSSLVDANNRLDVVGGANLDQLNVAGVSTFGNVSIFNDDVRITAGGLNVVGVATFSTNVNVTGTLDAGLIDGGTY